VVGDVELVAAFDVDGTLIRGQTQALLVQQLRSEGKLSLSTTIAVTLWFLGYKIGLPVRPDRILKRVLATFEGWAPEDLTPVMEALLQNHLAARLRPEGVGAIGDHVALGHRVVLVSAATEPVISTLAKYLGVEAVVATRLEVRDGRLTGRIDGDVVEGERKAKALTAWADATLSQWRLVAAYGDHESDEPLLRMAERPVAVCPSAGLRGLAARRGWTCVEWSALIYP
jgi:HAD superfamily hydrolase (TIGR01490 family)